VETFGAEEGQAHAFVSGKEEIREGSRQASRAAVSQSGRQYARRQEKVDDEEIDQEETDQEEVEMTGRKASALKNPKGGLTKAGRRWFEKKQGAHLKPGVKKSKSAMTPDDMRRKGSWAVRFYGRKGALPPLTKPNGEPTRFALTAAAWGEPVPKTVAAAKRIAAKGRKLLTAYAKAAAKSKHAKKKTAVKKKVAAKKK
jgi:hypothetical protein